MPPVGPHSSRPNHHSKPYDPNNLPPNFPPTSIPDAPAPQPEAPKKLNAFYAPALPVYPLPPLPPIRDAEIRTKVFTHTSLLTRQNRALLNEGIGAGKEKIGKGFEDLIDRPAKDYEKLEHVGDSILGMIITAWLHEVKPRLTIGTATKLKSYLVSNPTLSHLSTLYSLPARLSADPQVLPVVRAQPDIRAALFEAYIAGVYYSHPLPTRGIDAWRVLDPWLREVYAPMMEFFYTAMKNEYQAMVHASTFGPNGEDTSAIDTASQGMASLLQQWCSKNKIPIFFVEDKVDLKATQAEADRKPRIKKEEIGPDGLPVVKKEPAPFVSGERINLEDMSDIESVDDDIEEVKPGPKLSKITVTIQIPGGEIVKSCIRMNRKIARNVAAYEAAQEIGIAS